MAGAGVVQIDDVLQPEEATLPFGTWRYRLYDGPQAHAAFKHARKRVLAYDFYSPRIIKHNVGTNGLQSGDIIAQRIHLGPLRLAGPVQVIARWDEAAAQTGSSGFIYRALPGHPEEGVARFELVRSGSVVDFVIENRSRLRRPWMRLGTPVMRLIQNRVIRGAGRRLKASISQSLEASS